MSRRGITKPQFNHVIEMVAAKEMPEEICKTAGVSPSTVKAIKQAKTFEEYRRRNAERLKRAAARQPKVRIPVETDGGISAHTLDEAYRETQELAMQLRSRAESFEAECRRNTQQTRDRLTVQQNEISQLKKTVRRLSRERNDDVKASVSEILNKQKVKRRWWSLAK